MCLELIWPLCIYNSHEFLNLNDCFENNNAISVSFFFSFYILLVSFVLYSPLLPVLLFLSLTSSLTFILLVLFYFHFVLHLFLLSIASYSYSLFHLTFFVSSSPFCSLMETAREMIRESLPIKCLEAVILGMYPFLNAQDQKVVFVICGWNQWDMLLWCPNAPHHHCHPFQLSLNSVAWQQADFKVWPPPHTHSQA